MFEWKEVEFHSFNCFYGVDCNYINQMVAKLSEQYHKAEILTVINGERDGYVGTVSPQTFSDMRRQYSNLYFTVLAQVKPFKGFAHSFTMYNGPDAHLHIVMSRKYYPNLVRVFHQGGEEYHKLMGQILGYPECDVNWFIKYWNSNNKCCHTHYDLVWHMEDMNVVKADEKVVVRSANTLPEANPFLRYAGIRLIPYMPHSPICSESVKYGQMFAKYLDREVRQFAQEALSSPFMWDRYHGIVLIYTKKFVIANNTDFTQTKQIVLGNGHKGLQNEYENLLKRIFTKTS